ncbi:hypothetical protein CL647_01705 [bacterium]|nr:hypothetical protein [bacterium]|tara:strand:- start:1069 stop:3141 length:2073 start_codon:yes stop_codon:yes gene_type:complete
MLSSNLKQSIPVTHTRPETPSFEDSCHSGTTMVSSLSSDGSAHNGTVIDLALFGNRSTTLKVKEAQPKQSRLSQFCSWCCGGFSKPDLGSISPADVSTSSRASDVSKTSAIGSGDPQALGVTNDSSGSKNGQPVKITNNKEKGDFLSYFRSRLTFGSSSSTISRIESPQANLPFLSQSNMLPATFTSIKTLPYSPNETVSMVGDLEGEYWSYVIAMRALGYTVSIEIDSKSGIPYAKFYNTNDKSQLTSPPFYSSFLDFKPESDSNTKSFVCLGDIMDRGIFGVITALSMNRNMHNEHIKFKFYLGNHDLYNLLLKSNENIPCVPSEMVHPSNFYVDKDTEGGFEFISDLFREMNEQGCLKLIEWDSSVKRLTSHAVFTSGFLEKFIDFLNSEESGSFKEFIKGKFSNEGYSGDKILTLLSKMPDFEDWKNPKNQDDFMKNLEMVINGLIHPNFINTKENRDIVKTLFYDSEPESFIWQKGVEKYYNSPDSEEKYYAPFNTKNFPLPLMSHVNGHYPAFTRKSGQIEVTTPHGKTHLYKLDCATSSSMYPGGFNPSPLSVLIDSDGKFEVLKMTFGSNFNINSYLKRLKEKINDISGSPSNNAKFDFKTPMALKSKIMLSLLVNKLLNSKLVQDIKDLTEIDKIKNLSRFYNDKDDTVEVDGKDIPIRVILEADLYVVKEMMDQAWKFPT